MYVCTSVRVIIFTTICASAHIQRAHIHTYIHEHMHAIYVHADAHTHTHNSPKNHTHTHTHTHEHTQPNTQNTHKHTRPYLTRTAHTNSPHCISASPCASSPSLPSVFVTALGDNGWSNQSKFIALKAQKQPIFGYFRKEVSSPCE